jgi:hypothetical protein
MVVSSDRLLNCARCQQQLQVCRRCEHGLRYCPDPCARQACREWLRADGPSQALPVAWRQFQDEPRGMRRDALDYIAQIHERIDLQVLAGLHPRTPVRCAAASLPPRGGFRAAGEFCTPAQWVQILALPLQRLVATC